MGVNRTDYLMWGSRVDPKTVSEKYDELEPEIDGALGARFDLVYDVMSGKYAVAGRIVARSDPYEGIEFKVLTADDFAWDPELVCAVRSVFPDASEFSLFLFSHYN